MTKTFKLTSLGIDDGRRRDLRSGVRRSRPGALRPKLDGQRLPGIVLRTWGSTSCHYERIGKLRFKPRRSDRLRSSSRVE